MKTMSLEEIKERAKYLLGLEAYLVTDSCVIFHLADSESILGSYLEECDFPECVITPIVSAHSCVCLELVVFINNYA